MYETERQQVVEAARRLYSEKLVAGTSGNVSLCSADRRHIIITPSSYDYSIMQAADIVVIDLEGAPVEGRLAPSSEWRMHAEIYRRVPRACAVVHTHSPYATSFAAARRPIPVFLVEMPPFLGGSLEVAAYAAQGTAEVGTSAAAVLQNRNACLMAGHGAVAIGKDMASAYTSAVYMEDAAKIYHLALAVGEPPVLDL